jgi:hypothetical protein
MRKLIALAIAGFMFAQAVRADDQPGSNSDNFDSLLASIVKTLNEVGDTLGKISDEKAAKEAAPKLEKLAKEMANLHQRGQKLGKPSGEIEKTLEAKYKNDLAAASKKLTGEIERLKGQPYGKSVLEALKPKAEKPKAPAEKPKNQ